MPSGGGARAVVSGNEEVADVKESVRVDMRDGSEAIVQMVVLLKRSLDRVPSPCALVEVQFLPLRHFLACQDICPR